MLSAIHLQVVFIAPTTHFSFPNQLGNAAGVISTPAGTADDGPAVYRLGAVLLSSNWHADADTCVHNAIVDDVTTPLFFNCMHRAVQKAGNGDRDRGTQHVRIDCMY